MLFQVVIENGVKKIQALTADTGAGAPVGSFIYMYKKSSPSGYLYCDGSTFGQTKYPALYQYLGSNVLPDYRECVAVGAEQNTTDTIASHDVYTEGQFKDDQLQDHGHSVRYYNAQGSNTRSVFDMADNNIRGSWGVDVDMPVYNARHGDTTHGKQKAVFIYIKATSGLTENQQENVLNTINENLSYSTTEHKTGKKWIDGKDIYSIVLSNSETIAGETPLWGGLQSIITNLNIDYCITSTSTHSVYGTRYLQFIKASGFISFYSGVVPNSKIILEYTKTTDN